MFHYHVDYNAYSLWVNCLKEKDENSTNTITYMCSADTITYVGEKTTKSKNATHCQSLLLSPSQEDANRNQNAQIQ